MSESFLDREEYIEQAYFFKTYRERLSESTPAQEILERVGEELLATTKLVMAIEFLRGEILHSGTISEGMAHLAHYFTPFQTFVIQQAEAEKSKFDMKIALMVLEREAEYLSNTPTQPGLFIYQFESISRNRLGYHDGIKAIIEDPFYDEDWKKWIHWLRHQIGMIEFSELVYRRSEWFWEEKYRKHGQVEEKVPIPLFGTREGRIAKANRGKDPFYFFAALQRQLGYPQVPRTKRKSGKPVIHPMLEARLHKIEQRIQLLENEARDQFDLRDFYEKPPDDPIE